MKKENQIKKEFFAAANSGKGFVSFYSQIFEDKNIKRRYLIKGGPGTGKSTFMKALAESAQKSGLEVECFRCSSDPSSLDAVIIAGRVAVIDATSPHSVEGEYVGARDEIINLGEFWNSDALGEKLEEIRNLSDAKKSCYARAYRFLDAAMQVDEVCRAFGRERLDRAKMAKAVKRLLKNVSDENGFELKTRLCDSIGMSGRVRLDGYERSATEVYVINDEYKLGSTFLAMLVEAARDKKCAVSISYDPINLDYPDALLFENSGVAFVLGDGAENDGNECLYINMKRFVKKIGENATTKKEYRYYSRMFDGLVQAAQDELAKAGAAHFALEELYKGNMDFASQSEFLSDISKKIIGAGKQKEV